MNLFVELKRSHRPQSIRFGLVQLVQPAGGAAAASKPSRLRQGLVHCSAAQRRGGPRAECRGAERAEELGRRGAGRGAPWNAVIRADSKWVDAPKSGELQK